MTHSMEGNRLNSLWGVMNVIERGQGTSEDANEVREKVVAAVEKGWKAGEMQEPLPQGETEWQAYVQKM